MLNSLLGAPQTIFYSKLAGIKDLYYDNSLKILWHTLPK